MAESLIDSRQKKLAAEFSALANWEERYKRLIEKGKNLPEMPKELYDEKFKIRGCQSQVWLHAALSDDKRVMLQADSDALIVKGLVALLLEIYSGATPDDILNTKPEFLKELGLEGHLSPSRANGLFAMLKQILLYAQAFQAMSRA